MTILAALIRRDIALAWRQGGGVGTAFGFLLTVVVLIPLSAGPDHMLLQRIAPGVIWIGLLLSVLLSAQHIFSTDYEDGSLAVMIMGPAALELVVLAKACAHWLTAGLPLALGAPFLGLLLNITMGQLGVTLAAMAVGSAALSLLAALGAAITVGLRTGGLLVSLLILPLYVPVLIFGVSVSTGAGAAMPAFMILVAMVLVVLVVAPIGAAAALRAHLK